MNQRYTDGPWILSPIDFFKIAKMKNHVPISIFNDRGIEKSPFYLV